MGKIYRSLVRFLCAEDGPTAVEYAVMLALMLLVCIVAVGAVGTKTNSMLGDLKLRGTLGGSS